MPTLADLMPCLGHRNWIAVVDAAFPDLIAPGMTSLTGPGLVDVLRAIERTSHVRPVAFLDVELEHLTEADVPGIEGFRHDLMELLDGVPVRHLPHEKIIQQLADAGQTFRVVVVKTPATMPYTSVFIRLECGYWDEESEARLRDRMLGLTDLGDTLECP